MKWTKIILPIVLLAGGAILCIARWQAWFGMPAEPQWRGETVDFVFSSFSHDSTPESLDILVLGDIHNHLTTADYDTLAARVPQTDIVAQVGDWMDRGQRYYQRLLIREWAHSAMANTPVLATPGNHEYSKGLKKTLSPIWDETFPHPMNGPQAVPGASYYVDLPQVRFIAIDTNPLDRLVYLTRTLTWLHELLQEAGDRYVIVMMHHPVLSAGKGRANPIIFSAFRHALGEADLVLAGHDHSYMRRTPFVVLNTAGKLKQQRTHLRAEVADTVPVYGLITIPEPQSAANPQSQMVFRVYSLRDGALLDSLYVDHH